MKYLLVVLVCLATQFASAFVGGVVVSAAEETTPVVPPQTVTLTVGPKFAYAGTGRLSGRIQCGDLQSINDAFTRDGVTTMAMDECRGKGCQYCAVLSISIANSKCDTINNSVASADGKAVIQGFNCLP